MFDVGFSEIMLIGVVALVVLGPERLPKAARTAGALIGRMQRYVAAVKADINRELAETEELKGLKDLRKEVEEAGTEIESSMRQNMLEAQQEVQQIQTDVGANMANASRSMTEFEKAALQTTSDAAGQPAATVNTAPVSEPLAPEPHSPQLELALDDTPPAAVQSVTPGRS